MTYIPSRFFLSTSYTQVSSFLRLVYLGLRVVRKKFFDMMEYVAFLLFLLLHLSSGDLEWR